MIIDEILELPELYKKEIDKMRRTKASIILFGAGCTSQSIVEQLSQKDIFPIAFCDNDKTKIGSTIAGLDVIGIKELRNDFPESYIYITTQMYYSEIKQQLIKMGFLEEQISNCDIIYQFTWEEDYRSFCQKNSYEIERLFHSLEDEKSKKVLWNRLAFLCTRNRKYILSIRDYEQYFDKEIIDINHINNFVDIGTYTGDTIKEFMKRSKDKSPKVWGFEPDSKLCLIARKLFEGVEDIQVVQMAASDKDGYITVNSTLGMMQSIARDTFEKKKIEENVFETCRLDTFFKKLNVKVEFVKMDIEGAELAALYGSEELLKKNHPILAICVYHKQDDILSIPKFIKSLSDKYRLYFRHYSDNQTETVCYAVYKET